MSEWKVMLTTIKKTRNEIMKFTDDGGQKGFRATVLRFPYDPP